MNEETRKAIRKQAEEKAQDLREFFFEVKKNLSDQKIETAINPLFLTDACESTFIDLERHKDFHRLEIADRHKRGAFLFKWLSRIRPITLLAYKQGPGAGKAIHVNGWFALMAALGELNVDVHQFAYGKLSHHMIYTASYRDIHAESWALTFCLLESQFPKKNSLKPSGPHGPEQH